jgi:long-chain acyl-CoA synthetase
MVEYLYLAGGGSIAYAESIEKVPANILEIRPTVMSSVPRVLEKVRARILEAVRSEPWIKRRLFYWSLRAGRKRIRKAESGRPVTSGASPMLRLADRLVHDKIRERLGGRLRFIVSGGAPLPREIADFFLSAGIIVLEGYGLTETSPVISVNTLEHMRVGTVGRIIPGIDVKLDEDGEILVKGPNVMQGYFRNPEATDEVMRGGWFATGDIGTIDREGFLTITDRKKDILITSGGKNIAPQPIENALKAMRLIANAVLIGDKRNFVSALIVPDFAAVRRLAGREGWGDLSPKELASHEGVRKAFQAEVDAAMLPFGQFERVRKFTLLEREFAAEEGEITPTLKVRRRVVLEHFAQAIDAMYEA